MGLIMGLLVGVLRMIRKVRLLKQSVDSMKSHAIDSLSVRKGSEVFNRSDVVSGMSEF